MQKHALISLSQATPKRHKMPPSSPHRSSQTYLLGSRHFAILPPSQLQLPRHRLGRLPPKNLHPGRRRRRRLLQDTRAHLLDLLPDVDVLPVNVVPRAAHQEGDVVRQVQDHGDEGQAAEEEEDAVCALPRVLANFHKFFKSPNKSARAGARTCERSKERKKRTDGEFFARLHHVDSNGEFEVVFLEAKPFLERGELRHGRCVVIAESVVMSFSNRLLFLIVEMRAAEEYRC